jgi:hypothetical protein
LTCALVKLIPASRFLCGRVPFCYSECTSFLSRSFSPYSFAFVFVCFLHLLPLSSWWRQECRQESRANTCSLSCHFFLLLVVPILQDFGSCVCFAKQYLQLSRGGESYSETIS